MTATESIDDVHARPARQLAHLVGPVALGVVDAGVGAELASAGELLGARRGHDHPCPGLPGERDRERGDPAAGAQHQHRLVGHDAGAREERAVGREAGEGKGRGLLPGEVAGLRVEVLLRHGDQLRVGSLVPRAAQDAEVGTGRVLRIAPGHRRQDHDLFAGVAAHAGAVRSDDQRQALAVGARPHSDVVTVQRGGTELDEGVPRRHGGLGHLLMAEDRRVAPLVDDDGLHARCSSAQRRASRLTRVDAG